MESAVSEIVTITHADTSQNGKARVYFNGKNDWKDAYYIKQGLYAPSIGQVVEVETHSWTPPGKQHAIWNLDSWKPATLPQGVVGAAQRAAEPTRYPAQGNGRLPVVDAPAQALKGWDVLPGDLSRFVSNVIGSAIEAKLILKPGDINAWTLAAYRSAQRMTDGSYASEWPDGPDPSTHAGNPDQEFTDSEIPF